MQASVNKSLVQTDTGEVECAAAGMLWLASCRTKQRVVSRVHAAARRRCPTHLYSVSTQKCAIVHQLNISIEIFSRHILTHVASRSRFRLSVPRCLVLPVTSSRRFFMSERSPAIVLDARLSPALAVSPGLLRIAPPRRAWPLAAGASRKTLIYDETLRWLTASDRIVSDQVSRALLEVKEARMHIKEGHARWSTYLRAFVPMTARWSEQEIRRARALREYPALAAAWVGGALSKSHLRVVLRVVTRDTEEVWLQRASVSTVRELEELATREREAAAKAGSVTAIPP